MKKDKVKTAFLEQLAKIPIIQLACEKVGVSRATVYRWRADDNFKKQIDEALKEGEKMINDMSEAQVIALIKEKKWQAISFWLRHHHPKYAQRIEITTREPQEELNPEQAAVVKEALRLSFMPPVEIKPINTDDLKQNESAQEKPPETVENEQTPEKPKEYKRMTRTEFRRLEEVTEPIIVPHPLGGEIIHGPHGEQLVKQTGRGACYTPPRGNYPHLLEPHTKRGSPEETSEI